RLFIYSTEANEKDEPERTILLRQFAVMSKRLWYGITFPSAILTLIFGPWVLWQFGYFNNFEAHTWLHVKLLFVVLLYAYHFSLHKIFRRIQAGIFPYSSQQLRLWNEVATLFLVAIVMLAVVKQSMSWIWGLLGFIGLGAGLMAAIKIYKNQRKKH